MSEKQYGILRIFTEQEHIPIGKIAKVFKIDDHIARLVRKSYNFDHFMQIQEPGYQDFMDGIFNEAINK